MNFKLSLFQYKWDTTAQPVMRTWPQLCDRFAKPVVRAEKDGLLFSPATFSPAHRLNQNVIELSLLVLDCDHDAEFETLKTTLQRLNTAFAIYSTHSHRRVTEKNPQAEARYRVVVPLAEPIPAKEFPYLWLWATEMEGMTADRQVKDVARIYYTPVKFDENSPYEFFIADGPLLDWKALPLKTGESCDESSATDEADVQQAASATFTAPAVAEGPAPRVRNRTSGQGGTVLSEAGGFVKVLWDNGQTSFIAHDQLLKDERSAAGPSEFDFRWHEDRHEELCRRIKARGKRNGRGNYDARCLAHGGKGTTSLCYFPGSAAVVCNAGCDYQALLRAEGLSDTPLRSKERAQLAEERTRLRALAKTDPHGIATPETLIAPPPLSAARLHAIYGVLLAHLLYLTEKDEQLIYRELRTDPYGLEPIAYPDGIRAPTPIKICSMPTHSVQAHALGELSKWFDLNGVPGFFRTSSALPQSPDQSRPDGWRINLPYKAGLLAPYDNGSGYIIGIRIYLFTDKRRSIAANFLKTPFLLSSNGFPCGAKAIACKEGVAA